MRFFRRRSDFILIIVLVVVSVALLVSNLRAKDSLNFPESFVVSVFAPFQNAVDWAVMQVADSWDDYVDLLDARQETKHLTTLLVALELKNQALKEKLKSYDRLETLLTFPDISEIPFEVARVVGRDTANRMKVMTLNKGSNHGIEVNMPVVTHHGLIGRVMRVAGSASKVLLLTDVRSAIDVITQNSRVGFVAVGANSTSLETKYLDVNSAVANGVSVISSGLGGIFPKGLFVGYLENISKVEGDLFLNAQLSLAVDLNRLEEVLVLKGSVVAPAELDKKEITASDGAGK